MKIHRRVISVVLSVALCISAVICVSAANREVAPVSAKTGLVPIGNGIDYYADLPVTLSDLPQSYNSADYGYTLPVRQQHGNTCWAFGALSTFETLLLKNGEDIEPLAPQHANFWGTPRPDGTGWQRESHNPGYSYIPLGYLMSWAGPVNESDFPEEGTTQEDYDNFSLTPEYGLNEAIYFNSDADRDAIKELIYRYGSVVGNFNSDQQYLSDDTSFYCADHNLTINQLLGHCISVVGWDDSYPKENFKGSISGTPDQDGAWLIKNSWGYYNNLGGYFWISYEDAWIFDDIFGPSYALTSYEKITDNVKLYQNEVDGATYEFEYLNRYSSITFMNAFDFTEDHRNIDEVIFESTSLGSTYKIYYIPFDGDTPTNETGLWTELYSGEITYTGYICADVEDTTLPVGKGAIGIKITSTNSRIPAGIGVSEWLQSAGRYIFLPQAEKGMSYYMTMNSKSSKVQDVMDFYKNSFAEPDEIGGTFVIKAITRNNTGDPIGTDPTESTPAPTEPVTSTAPTETTAPTTSTAPTETTAPAISTAPTETTAPAISTAPTSTTSVPVTTEATETETVTSSELYEPFIYKLGDSNLDGIINVKDATQIQKSAAMIIVLTPREFMASDVTGNGAVNVVDATNIQKFVAGLETRYDVGKVHIHFE